MPPVGGSRPAWAEGPRRAPTPYDGGVDPVLDALAALLPSAGVLALFVVAIRAVMRADSNERAAVAEFERTRAETATQASADSRD